MRHDVLDAGGAPGQVWVYNWCAVRISLRLNGKLLSPEIPPLSSKPGSQPYSIPVPRANAPTTNEPKFATYSTLVVVREGKSDDYEVTIDPRTVKIERPLQLCIGQSVALLVDAGTFVWKGLPPPNPPAEASWHTEKSISTTRP